jgi:hypothetical protein
VCDLTYAPPPGMRLFDEFAEQRTDSGPPLPPHALGQPGRQLLIAGDVPRIQHGQAGRYVGAGNPKRLGNRAHAVIKTNVRVPQRIPQLIRDLPHGVGGHTIMQQQEVQVRVGHQLATAQRAGRHDRKAAAARDTDLCGVCDQPRFVQITPRLAQSSRIEFTRPAGEQAFPGCG